jgi:hypothetical protein
MSAGRLMAGVALAGIVAASAVAQPAPDIPVIHIQFEDAGTAGVVTAVLVHREGHPTGVVLYFITSSRLVAGLDGEGEGSAAPDGGLAVVAVARLVDDLVPVPVALASPAVADRFEIYGRDPDGQLLISPQRVTRSGSSKIVGDRPLASLPSCLGAPAISQEAVFGIVTSCDAGHPPVVTLLSSQLELLRARIPGFDPGGGREFHPVRGILRGLPAR